MAREATDTPSPEPDALGSSTPSAPSLPSRILGVAAVAIVAIVVTLSQTVAIVADDAGEGDRVLGFVSSESESNVSADQYPWGITRGDTTYAWSTAGLLLIAVATAAALAGVLAGPTLLATVNRRRSGADGSGTDLLATPARDAGATFAYIPATETAPSPASPTTTPPAPSGSSAPASLAPSNSATPPPPAPTANSASPSLPDAPSGSSADTKAKATRGSSKRRFFGRKDETSGLEFVDIASALETSTRKASRKGRARNKADDTGSTKIDGGAESLASSVPSALEAIAASKPGGSGPSDTEVDLAEEASGDAFDWSQVADSLRDSSGDAPTSPVPVPDAAPAAASISSADMFGMELPGAVPYADAADDVNASDDVPEAPAAPGDTDILRIFRVDDASAAPEASVDPLESIGHETWGGATDFDTATPEPDPAEDTPFDWDVEIAKMSDPRADASDGADGHGTDDTFDPYPHGAAASYESFDPTTLTTTQAPEGPADALDDPSQPGSTPGIDALRAHLDVDLPPSVVQGAPPADEPTDDVPDALRSLMPAAAADPASAAIDASPRDNSMSSLDWLAELEQAMGDDHYADPAPDPYSALGDDRVDLQAEESVDVAVDVSAGDDLATRHEVEGDDTEGAAASDAELEWSDTWTTWVYYDAARDRWFGHEAETDRWLPLPADSNPLV